MKQANLVHKSDYLGMGQSEQQAKNVRKTNDSTKPMYVRITAKKPWYKTLWFCIKFVVFISIVAFGAAIAVKYGILDFASIDSLLDSVSKPLAMNVARFTKQNVGISFKAAKTLIFVVPAVAMVIFFVVVRILFPPMTKEDRIAARAKKHGRKHNK